MLYWSDSMPASAEDISCLEKVRCSYEELLQMQSCSTSDRLLIHIGQTIRTIIIGSEGRLSA